MLDKFADVAAQNRYGFLRADARVWQGEDIQKEPERTPVRLVAKAKRA